MVIYMPTNRFTLIFIILQNVTLFFINETEETFSFYSLTRTWLVTRTKQLTNQSRKVTFV